MAVDVDPTPFLARTTPSTPLALTRGSKAQACSSRIRGCWGIRWPKVANRRGKSFYGDGPFGREDGEEDWVCLYIMSRKMGKYSM